MLYSAFKKIAFQMDPEQAHELSLKVLSKYPLLASSLIKGCENNEKYSVKLNGLNWSFPIGLAAGLDKNGVAIDYFNEIGFGAVEVGTVTPRAQEGNPKPRLFRYIEEESLRNCMGFNNAGAIELERNIHLSHLKKSPLGINLGKNKTTSQDKACEDYLYLYKQFAKVVDYLVINVSSPNTPGLRDLQKTEALEEILVALKSEREKSPTPLYVKISPDLNHEDIVPTIDLAKKMNLSGIIATNTTIMPDRGIGGVSGKALRSKATELRNSVLEVLKETPEIDLIGVGGVSNFNDLWEFWKRGGKAMQVYSSFIYQGPKILSDFKNNIDDVLEKNEFRSVSELLSNIEKAKR